VDDENVNKISEYVNNIFDEYTDVGGTAWNSYWWLENA